MSRACPETGAARIGSDRLPFGIEVEAAKFGGREPGDESARLRQRAVEASRSRRDDNRPADDVKLGKTGAAFPAFAPAIAA